ncbi:hypothetical protein CDL12_10354 [Handroanthus impetiginosus]|uniref:Retrotransposon gag domain-containing protein n=1 Tax=Handroanthus impetiginosus TaxID=429701 RepID=A0A2G9HHJ8_9LAMI|nr:hypothetical protein CDL12_10354 [Handroanthus impetiginosus]
MQSDQQPINPSPTIKTRIRQDDLIAITIVVVQAMQTENQHQDTTPNQQPNIMGTKFHFKALKRAQVPTFDRTQDPEVVQRWFKEMEDNFDLMEVPFEVRPKVVVPFLMGEATRCRSPITWARFREAYLKHFFPNAVQLQKMVEFDNLTQHQNMPMVEYSTRFHSLGKYSPVILADPELKIHKFTRGLKSQIQSTLAVFEATSFDELLGTAIRAELVQRPPMEALANPINRKGPTLPRPQFPECNYYHRRQGGECWWKNGEAIRNPAPGPTSLNPSLKLKGNARAFTMT